MPTISKLPSNKQRKNKFIITVFSFIYFLYLINTRPRNMPLPTHVDRQLQPLVSNISSETSCPDHFRSECDHSVGWKFSEVCASKIALSSTPGKATSAAIVSVSSPGDSLFDDSFHSYNNSEIDEFEASTVIKRIGKSDHKIEEENGLHAEEPLLKENPHRFVLFPIEDNEVSFSGDVSEALIAVNG